MALRLDQEVLPLLDQTPIAGWAVQRVQLATKGDNHLLQPALGRRGCNIVIRHCSKFSSYWRLSTSPSNKPSSNRPSRSKGDRAPVLSAGFPGVAKRIAVAERQALLKQPALNYLVRAERQQAIAEAGSAVAQQLRPGTPPATWASRAEQCHGKCSRIDEQGSAVACCRIRTDSCFCSRADARVQQHAVLEQSVARSRSAARPTAGRSSK